MSVEEMMAELEKLNELERLVATLPSSPPPSPSRSSRGLSFSVAGVGLGPNTSSSSSSSSSSKNPAPGSSGEGWENTSRMPSDLLDTTLSLDFGLVGLTPGAPLPMTGVSSQNPEPIEQGPGKLLVQYVGGSVTFLFKIAVVAWSVRFLRRVWAQRRKKTEQELSGVVDSPLFSEISWKALEKLVELENMEFLVIDVRDSDEASSSPLPLENAVNIPESEVTTCLQLKEKAWNTRFPSVKKPAGSDLLVFVSTTGKRAEQAAIATAKLNFNRCCVVSGGIQSRGVEADDDTSSGIKFLSRDAVAFLLQEQPEAFSERQMNLVDVRRHEERSLYGGIPGSLHIPAEDWPKALAMNSDEWEKKFGFPKFEKDTVVILYSRTCKRAMWTAQLCADSGLSRCYVCQSGSYYWRLDSTVLPYDDFRQGEAPPEALEFSVETFNPEIAEAELKREGFEVPMKDFEELSTMFSEKHQEKSEEG